LAVICVGLILGACSTGALSGGPKSPFDLAADIAAVEAQLESQASIEAYYRGAETRERRDAFVAARMSLIDLSYARYVSGLNATRAVSDTTFDIGNVAIGVANTVVGGDQDRRVLSAITAILTGTRSSIEDAFFDGQTTDLLITQMNSARRQASVRILEGLQQDIADYPLTAALVDLNEYYQAGTVHGALMSSLVSAAREQAAAEARIEQLRSVSFTRDESAAVIGRWLFPTATGRNGDGVWITSDDVPAPGDSQRAAALRAWLATQGLEQVPIGTFLTAPLLAETRGRAVSALNIPTG
jgi:hypothetical protein